MRVLTMGSVLKAGWLAVMIIIFFEAILVLKAL
jgi:hypothetical protein